MLQFSTLPKWFIDGISWNTDGSARRQCTHVHLSIQFRLLQLCFLQSASKINTWIFTKWEMRANFSTIGLAQTFWNQSRLYLFQTSEKFAKSIYFKLHRSYKRNTNKILQKGLSELQCITRMQRSELPKGYPCVDRQLYPQLLQYFARIISEHMSKRVNKNDSVLVYYLN